MDKLTEVRVVFTRPHEVPDNGFPDGAWCVVVDGIRRTGFYTHARNAEPQAYRLAQDVVNVRQVPVLVVGPRGAYVLSLGTYPQPAPVAAGPSRPSKATASAERHKADHKLRLEHEAITDPKLRAEILKADDR